MRILKGSWVLFLLILLLAAGSLAAQSRELAAIRGRVMDESGGPLPGVAVTVTSPSMMGKPSAVTDSEGRYHIPALVTGVYEVSASLGGFAPAKITGVDIHLGMTATVDIRLVVAKVESEVTVIGAAPVVDVTKATLASTYITRDMLTKLPTSQNTHSILNLAPGVTQLSAYGGGDQSGNSWTIDGAEVSSSWFGGGQYSTPIDYNVVEEQQVIALGAPAEYGGFTGTAVNIITKAGGNEFHGDAQVLYRGQSWQSQNIKAGDEKWRLLGETPATEFLSGSAHLGGPIIRDKLWFFGGYEYFKQTITLQSTGKDSPRTLPKLYLKLTFQPTPKDRIQASYETHTYNALRTQMDNLVTPDGNWDDLWDSNLINAFYLHTFSDDSIFEFKFGANWGSWNRYPSHKDINQSGFWDLVNGTHACYWWSVQPDHKTTYRGSYTKRAENLAGSHDFKVGLEVEQSGGNWDMTVTGGIYYLTLDNQPYLGVETHGFQGFSNMLYSGYIQDDWQITDRLVFNPGVRYNMARGKVPGVEETVWKPHQGLEPRIGLVWDITGKQSTVFKAHVGRYYEGTRSYNYWSMTPQTDTNYYLWNAETSAYDFWYTQFGANLFEVDPNVRNPSMDQAVLGLEQVLGQNMSASVSFIYKKWLNFVDAVDLNATYEEVPYVNPLTGETMTVYNQTNVGATPHYLITNPQVGKDIGAAYPMVLVDPSRKYAGIQFTFNKRFADRWQLAASYTYSKEQGSYSNAHTATGSYGTGATGNYYDPNLQINLYGRSSISPPHVFKIMASYVLPWDINLSGVYVYNSGRTWTKTTTLTQLDQATKPYLLLEPSGDSRMDANNSLDFRLEKSFALSRFRLSVMLDVFNVLNQAIPWGQYGTYVDVFYGDTMGLPLYVCDPRVFRLGLRFNF